MLKTWNRYVSGTEPPNFGEDAVAFSVGVLNTWASLTGVVGVGAVTFSVDPSAAASASAAFDDVGEIGVAV